MKPNHKLVKYEPGLSYKVTCSCGQTFEGSAPSDATKLFAKHKKDLK